MSDIGYSFKPIEETVFENLKTLLHNRGLDISTFPSKRYKEKTFKIEAREDSDIGRERYRDGLVIYINLKDEKFGKKAFENVIEEACDDFLKEMTMKNVLIVNSAKISPRVKKLIKEELPAMNIERLSSNFFLSNRINHFLVPRCRLLPERKAEEVRNVLMYGKKAMQGITDDDPMVLYYGGRVGDIFEVTRVAMIIPGTYPFYRRVVKIPEEKKRPTAVTKGRKKSKKAESDDE